MNKYISTLGVSLALVATLSSCDLDTSPTTSLDAANAFRTTDYAEDVLKGAWWYVFNEGQTYQSIGIGSVMLGDDFMGSDCVKAKSYGFTPSYNLTVGYGRNQLNNVLWDFAYDAINNSNSVIAYVDNASGTEADKNRIKGQAYATRGFMYMMLASHFSFAIDKDPNAVCVPIYTEPTTMSVALTGNPASSVTEVYDQAFADLKQAVELIPSSYTHGTTASDQYKIDYTVALGLLARTSLYARKWQDAYDYATRVLERNNYLMSEAEFKGGFGDCSNKEWLWSYHSTIDDNMQAYVYYFKDNSMDGYGSLCVDPYFVDNYSDNDYRKDLFQTWGYTPQGGKVIKLLNDKFKMQSVDDQLADMNLMRVAEIYLIKAEAACRLGKTAEAQTLLHTLQQARMKDGYTAPEVTATGDDLLSAIWMERRKELWGEGFAITDIIRNQQSIARKAWSGEVTVDGEKMEGEGHTTVQFNDGTPFVANSKYYLFRITETEELQNQNLYSKYPKLDLYR